MTRCRRKRIRGSAECGRTATGSRPTPSHADADCTGLSMRTRLMGPRSVKHEVTLKIRWLASVLHWTVSDMELPSRYPRGPGILVMS